MNKYQKALDNIVISSCPIAIRSKEPCSSCKINKTCNTFAKDWVDTLQELVDNKETPVKEVAKTDYLTVDRMGVSEVDGDFFKATREKLHLSQTTFASIIGVKVKTLIKWEKGKKKINDTAKILIKTLNNFPLVFYNLYNVKKEGKR